jgi:hypothetical protein
VVPHQILEAAGIRLPTFQRPRHCVDEFGRDGWSFFSPAKAASEVEIAHQA